MSSSVGGASAHLAFNRAEGYSEPSQTFQFLNIFAKRFILDVWLDSEYTSVEFENCLNHPAFLSLVSQY